ncbi:hypothetical protein, partial [Mesorhizobium sp. M7A.F.Ca.US.007.01.1.1]|uniref:hypothetical protein n=1 Tax=Mesorhizobium sp. M7A.F.Ca.US.007.01.1.1 TaxID=2496712 RepID=UPI0019D2CEDC
FAWMVPGCQKIFSTWRKRAVWRPVCRHASWFGLVFWEKSASVALCKFDSAPKEAYKQIVDICLTDFCYPRFRARL